LVRAVARAGLVPGGGADGAEEDDENEQVAGG